MTVVIDGSNQTTGGLINSATAQATTSGTSIDFTGIPSTAKRITVMLSGVSTNGSSIPQIQIGAGSIDATSYVGAGLYLTASGVSNSALNSTGFLLSGQTNATAYTFSGIYTLALVGSNIWVFGGNSSSSDAARGWFGSGTKTLSGTLDRVRLTTVNGTDTFDAGSVNIFWE